MMMALKGAVDTLTGVGEVDADHLVLAREQGLLAGLCDFARLHVRCLVEGNSVTGDLHIRLQGLLEVAAAVAVPEECHLQPPGPTLSFQKMQRPLHPVFFPKCFESTDCRSNTVPSCMQD